MVDISLGGLIGAIVGTLAAAAIYGTLIDFVERRLKAFGRSNAEAQGASEPELALLRRGVLAFNVLVLGGLGYWIGDTIAG